MGEEDGCGVIRPGFRADLTAFAQDPVECDADDLPELPTVLTVVDGRPVFRALEAAEPDRGRLTRGPV